MSEESRRLAIQLYLAGEKVEVIARSCRGASAGGRLYRWIDEAGVPRRGQSTVDRALVAQLLSRGLRASQVAIRLGCHHSTIRKIRARLAASHGEVEA